jgi:hypothetical protein
MRQKTAASVVAAISVDNSAEIRMGRVFEPFDL